jgi:YD repeat-containing protein
MQPGSADSVEKTVKRKAVASVVVGLVLLAAIFATTISMSSPHESIANERAQHDLTSGYPQQRTPRDNSKANSSAAKGDRRTPNAKGGLALARAHRLNKHRFKWRGRVAAPGHPTGKLVWKSMCRSKPESPHGAASISTRSGSAGMPPADQFGYVEALAAGSNGSMYVADTQNNRVVKISSAGQATVVAGNGFYGQTGNGGLATKASLDFVGALAVDSEDNIYLSNIESIRKVDASTGKISRIAGTGSESAGCTAEKEVKALEAEFGAGAIAVSPSGTVYFLDGCTNGRVVEITPSGNFRPIAHVKYLARGIAFVGENLLVSSAEGISTVTPAGKVTAFVGYPESLEEGFSGDGGLATSAKFRTPQELAINEAGDIFVADSANGRIREINTEGTIRTLAGKGLYSNGDITRADESWLNQPTAVAVDSNGNLDIGTYPNGVFGGVRQVKASMGVVGPKSPITSFPHGQVLAGETNGGCNPSEQHGSHGCSGDPVDTLTGQYWQRDTDLSVPGRGFPVSLTRSYSSLGAEEAAGPGPLGYGWAFNYGMSLTNDEVSGDITIHQENGSTVLFVPNSSGTAYACDTRVLATLVHDESGTWTFTRKARQKFTFDAEGRLISEKDLNGEATSLAYEKVSWRKSPTPPAAN